LWKFIADYLIAEDVETIVVGEPKQMNYTESEIGPVIHTFVDKLKAAYPKLKIDRVDERFTSKMAFQTMIDSGLSKGKRRNKALVDEIAATIILQTYLSRIDY
jgi:putative Holliday junction resolvase